MVNKLSSMLKEDENSIKGVPSIDLDIIQECDRERQKSFRRLRRKESIDEKQKQDDYHESIFDLIQGFDSRRELTNPPFTVKAEEGAAL